MRKLISYQNAGKTAIVLYLLLLVFHIMVLVRIVPYHIVWGGQVESYEALIPFEVFSLILFGIAAWLTAALLGYTGTYSLRKIARIFVMIMFLLFALNTIGNLLAVSKFEKFFAILTLVLALLNLRLSVDPVKR